MQAYAQKSIGTRSSKRHPEGKTGDGEININMGQRRKANQEKNPGNGLRHRPRSRNLPTIRHTHRNSEGTRSAAQTAVCNDVQMSKG